MLLGELDSNTQKNETTPVSYSTHQNKLKMDKGPECETGNHQTLGGESRKKKKKTSLTSAAAISYLTHPQRQGN